MFRISIKDTDTSIVKFSKKIVLANVDCVWDLFCSLAV